MKTLTEQIQKQFDKMCTYGTLFRANITGDTLWTMYLKAFEQDPIFRDPASSEHNCNNCKNFFRRYGNIIAINSSFEIESIFSNLDLRTINSEFHPSIAALDILLRNSSISDAFVETFQMLNTLPYEKTVKTQAFFRLGMKENFKQYTTEEAMKFGVVSTDKVYTFTHLHLSIPAKFILNTNDSVEALTAVTRDKFQVFNRLLTEIPKDTILLVKDLILQNSLLNGSTYLPLIEQIINLYETYDTVPAEHKANWTWLKVSQISEGLAKFRNSLIGTLCVELSEGKELNEACKNWNIRIDPVNYMKAVAPITKTQIEQAKKFVQENGYEESFTRRLATIDDIKASEILHINRDNSKANSVNIFDNVSASSGKGRFKRSEFKEVTSIPIDKFMQEILPTCTSLEVFLEGKFKKNLVNLTTSAENSKPIFKWNNPFSFTFNGNLASKSEIKENVKMAGGNTSATLRCSLQWNDTDTPGIVDLDLHCKEKLNKTDSLIYYGSKNSYYTDGYLDVDMINPTKIGIENITYRKPLQDGVYTFKVNNFNSRSNKGFKCEIQLGEDVFQYHYSQEIRGTDITVAEVTVKNGIASITHKLPESQIDAAKLWGLDTNEFHKVNLVCLSPNYWNSEVGHKHYLFMLKNCKNPDKVRSFHNEHLLSELLQHRKVLDVLGATTLVDSTPNQLAGIGFNATVSEELIVKIKGSHTRMLKIIF